MHAIADAVTSPQRLSQSIRRHNRGIVLRTLLRERVASRADLARLTGLTRPTISDVVKGLLSDGVIHETGIRPANGPGKPAVLLEFDHNATQVLAIDLSSRGFVAAALVRPDGTVLQRISRPIASDASLQAVARELTAVLVDASTHPLLGVGVAVATGFDAEAELVSALSALTTAPVHIAIDTDLAANAEYRFSDIKEDFLLVRVGERTSSTIFSGTPSVSRELAHSLVDGTSSESCRCGRAGCLHSWIAAALHAHQPLAEADAATQRQLRIDSGARLGTALASIVAALDLPRVVLSGPEALIDDDFCAAAESALRVVTRNVFDTEPEVVHRAQVSDAVLRGAASHVAALEVSGF